MSGEEKVWYACYGSNLSVERFFCYIEGGRPAGAGKFQQGCNDKKPPDASEAFTFPASLYFAGHSQNWGGGGVAFIDPVLTDNHHTLSRIYLISKAQFVDLVKQEQQSTVDLKIDFDRVIREGSCVCNTDALYGKLLCLGHRKGHPVFTFTNKNILQPYNSPGERYLSVIIRGLRNTHRLDSDAITRYLLTKPGIKGSYNENELQKLIKQIEGQWERK